MHFCALVRWLITEVSWTPHVDQCVGKPHVTQVYGDLKTHSLKLPLVISFRFHVLLLRKVTSSCLSELFTTEDRSCARYLQWLWRCCRCARTECARAFHFSFQKRSGKSELLFYPWPKYSWNESTTSSANVRLTRPRQAYPRGLQSPWEKFRSARLSQKKKGKLRG